MDFISAVIAWLDASKYFLLFAGSYLEGTGIILTGGYLWHEGLVAFWPAYVALMMGDFLSDLMWYFIGYFAARRFILRWGHVLNFTPVVMEKVERRFRKHHSWILVVSKLTMGFGLAVATLMTAGMMRISLVRYITINLLCGIVWVMAVMIAGYYFGDFLALFPTKYQIGLTLAGIAAFILGVRYINARLAESEW